MLNYGWVEWETIIRSNCTSFCSRKVSLHYRIHSLSEFWSNLKWVKVHSGGKFDLGRRKGKEYYILFPYIMTCSSSIPQFTPNWTIEGREEEQICPFSITQLIHFGFRESNYSLVLWFDPPYQVIVNRVLLSLVQVDTKYRKMRGKEGRILLFLTIRFCRNFCHLLSSSMTEEQFEWKSWLRITKETNMDTGRRLYWIGGRERKEGKGWQLVRK